MFIFDWKQMPELYAILIVFIIILIIGKSYVIYLEKSTSTVVKYHNNIFMLTICGVAGIYYGVKTIFIILFK